MTYQLTLDEDMFVPVPESWLEHPAAVDSRRRPGPVVFAVSVASRDDRLAIRYASQNGNVLEATLAAHNGEDGFYPAAFDEDCIFPRSRCAGRDGPVGILRAEEWEHFESLWSDALAPNPETTSASGGGLVAR